MTCNTLDITPWRKHRLRYSFFQRSCLAEEYYKTWQH
jgi:hypothetical protein